MNWLQNDWSRRFGLILFFACSALLILSPLAVMQKVPNSIDYFNHLVGIILAKFALMDGQFPLRVTATQLWDYPYFQFYSSTTYTVAGLMYQWVFPKNPLAVYKLVLFMSAMIGGLYMYRLAYWFINVRSAAILSAFVYMTSPYYLLVNSRLGALNEAVAIGVIPVAVFYTVLCFYRSDRYFVLLQMSLAWYVLATVHNVTFLYTSLFVALLLLIYTLQNRGYLKNLFAVGGVYCFSLMLAAWYLAPIFSIKPNLSQHANNFIDLVRPNIGIFIVIAAGVCIYALVKQQGLKNHKANSWVLPLVVMFCVAFFFHLGTT